ncbi:MAG: membrane protein of unknown function [Parcubacteria group bacterium Gr01-1014_31]|nr:MAG: membrane protein of unknown function [Parcubacteria group bacterium Gr01-1014_31]
MLSFRSALGIGKPTGDQKFSLGIPLVIALASGVLLLVALLPLPYWLDEGASIFFVTRPLPEVTRYVANDIHPPLYFWLLHFWVWIVGTHPAATALLSLGTYAVALWYLFRLARLLYDRRTASITLLLCCSSFLLTYYATETRMYTLVLAAAMGAYYYLYASVRRPERLSLWVGCFLWNAVGVYTHYFYWLAVIAQTAFLGWQALRGQRRLLRRWGWLLTALVVAFIPWVPTMVARLTDKIGQLEWMQGQPWSGRLLATAIGALVPIDPISPLLPLPVRWTQVLLAGVIAAVAVKEIRWGQGVLTIGCRNFSLPATFLGVLIVIPPLIGQSIGAWFVRYFIYVLPLMSIIFARLIIAIPRVRVRQTVLYAWVVTVVAFNWWFALAVLPNRSYFSWPAVAQQLTRLGNPPEAGIVLVAQEEWVLLRHYYRGPLPLVSILPKEFEHGDPELDRLRLAALRTVTESNAGEALAVARSFRTIWLVEGPSRPLADPDRSIAETLGGQCRPGPMDTVFSSQGNDVGLTVQRFDDCAWDVSAIRPSAK